MFEKIQPLLSGEIYYKNTPLDEAIKTVYATDASEYQEKPIAVVLPAPVVPLKSILCSAMTE